MKGAGNTLGRRSVLGLLLATTTVPFAAAVAAPATRVEV